MYQDVLSCMLIAEKKSVAFAVVRNSIKLSRQPISASLRAGLFLSMGFGDAMMRVVQ